MNHKRTKQVEQRAQTEEHLLLGLTKNVTLSTTHGNNKNRIGCVHTSVPEIKCTTQELK